MIIDTSIGIEILESNHEEHEEHEEHESTILEKSEEHAHDHSRGDPHIWLNPVLAKTQVQNIADGLAKFNPENENYFRNNADKFITELDNLDQKITNELSSCKTDFIAYHNAFSYFADQYGLTQHTIVKTNDPHADPTSRHFEEIIHLAQELDLDIIFTEQGVDSRTAKVIADEFNATVLTLSPLEVIYDDSSYIENMEKNLLNLKVALCN